ncbi:hypothetical protein MOX02_38540 [Methylobacterium oxalidis]|uniref:Uncharacterized protein n=2 Tax=Methylobacterium oxalidis TaxID=944322 RepID=A0A512J773_9HYPH|nr:hypothetical protein MOX02_38540 [Methylobacterium oxalidis]GLS66479.1 hypothetical protein GCM10007888_48620 [Methylobacterium oxalidis]
MRTGPDAASACLHYPQADPARPPGRVRRIRMRFAPLAGLLGVACLSGAGDALAQAGREVPIEQDLRREELLERRLDRDRPPPVDPNVTPDNPDGVVGFDGPPGIPEDNIGDGPLPPGSPADSDDD